MEKYLVTIEFRYYNDPKYEHDSGFTTKTVTIGVYDTFDEACLHGNKLLENLESKFPLHRYPHGQNASKERFSKNGGPFRTKKDLVTDMAYLTTPFNFFAKIETLKHLDIDQTIIEVVESVKSYRAYKASI